jgi:hypothetical protein
VLLAKGSLVTDVGSDEYRPHVSRVLARRHRVFQLKVYVSEVGGVTRVLVFKGEEPEMNREVVSRIERWRYQPHLVGGKAVPFCFMMRLAVDN